MTLHSSDWIRLITSLLTLIAQWLTGTTTDETTPRLPK